MKRVTLVWKYGEEAICPECKHNNACLYTGQVGSAFIYECRDCHAIFAADHSMPAEEKGTDPKLGRKILERSGILVTRTLGKTCSKCGSFNIEHMNYEEMQESNKNAQNPWERKEYICRDCGAFWG